jgi:hypothetical protein
VISGTGMRPIGIGGVNTAVAPHQAFHSFLSSLRSLPKKTSDKPFFSVFCRIRQRPPHSVIPNKDVRRPWRNLQPRCQVRSTVVIESQLRNCGPGTRGPYPTSHLRCQSYLASRIHPNRVTTPGKAAQTFECRAQRSSLRGARLLLPFRALPQRWRRCLMKRTPVRLGSQVVVTEYFGFVGYSIEARWGRQPGLAAPICHPEEGSSRRRACPERGPWPSRTGSGGWSSDARFQLRSTDPSLASLTQDDNFLPGLDRSSRARERSERVEGSME